VLRCAAALSLAAGAASAQASKGALRFFGTGSGQQDRVRIQVDDNAPGPNASAPCDVGRAGFTLEFWLRGSLAANATENAGGDVLIHGSDWRAGNIVLDRDILGDNECEFGVSIAGGFVRFGTGGGDERIDHEHTLEGNALVLDDAWHHVACVRENLSGTLSIYVDGALDMLSEPGVSAVDLSYPNQGVPSQGSPWGNYLVLGAAKHDLGPHEKSFQGYFDELRVWNVARTAQEIALTWQRLVPPDSPGLAADYRFEEESGSAVHDASLAHSPDGELIAGLPGNGERTRYADDPASVAPLVASPLPPGFSMTVVTSALPRVTSMVAAPDGRLFVGQIDGTLWVLSNGQILPQPLIQIPAQVAYHQSGLLGMCLDPSFAQNGYLYAFYTESEPRNRVSRFTVVGDRASLASEFVVWQNVHPTPADRNGGGVEFAADGTILISTGDQSVPASASSLANEDGKLLRVNADGSIPIDNPYVEVPNAAPTIFALGFRNPFRICTDSLSAQRWVGDVGGSGLYAWEEVNAVAMGAHYGWPFQEGEACYVPTCAPYTAAAFAYRHGDPTYYYGVDQGSITAGVVYRGTAFPQHYRGNLFIGDYANQWVRRLVLDAAGHVTGDLPFIEMPNAHAVVDMAVGAEGALYLACFNGAAGQPSVLRVDASAPGNLPPVPVAVATPAQGLPPLAVQFDGQQSYDPDQSPFPLAYRWTFGDGAHATGPVAQHTYAQPGVYSALLSVDDGAGGIDSAPISIQIGTPPTPTIVAPLPGASYVAGQLIDLYGQATDAEDGTLPASAYTWRVDLVHGGHTHPFFGPIVGEKHTRFTVPTSGHPPENTFYRVLLTVTDADGLSSTAIVNMSPAFVQIGIGTQPSGVPVFVEGQSESTPHAYNSLPGYEVAVEAQRWTMIAQEPWLFRSWSDGGARLHTLTTPSAASSLVATYWPTIVKAIDVPVDAADRNAQYSQSTGQLLASPLEHNALWLGKQSGEPFQVALEFSAEIPRIATILSATIELTAANHSEGSAQIPIFAYDVADAPAFVSGSPTALAQYAPATGATVVWQAVDFQAGEKYPTPDLAALVQEIVDRPDWHPGAHVGIVFDGSTAAANALRSLRGFGSISPPRLHVTYAIRRYPTPKGIFGG
jgi:glucose/arabinose dehydrogenase